MSPDRSRSGDSNPVLRELEVRAVERRPVRVAIVGSGDYGETVAAQVGRVPGLHPSLICDLDEARARSGFACAGVSPDAVRLATDAAMLANEIEAGRSAIVTDPDLVPRAPVDVVVECTGDPEAGCRMAARAIDARIHVVMVNAEADATAGWILAERARSAGCVYTLADGDQPSLLTGLCDWASLLGFDVVAAGKWTRSHPPEEAHRLLTGMEEPTPSDVTNLDGTKTQIELACAANASGLSVDVAGMHGRGLSLTEIPDLLRPATEGGILQRAGVVDYVNTLHLSPGAGFRGGVFAVVTCPSERTLRALASKGVPMSSDGRHALLYRPQHLVGAETIRSIALAAIEHRPTATAGATPHVEVVAVAKRDLPAGTRVAGLASADVAGVAVNAADATAFLPVGLAAGVTLREDVPAGERLSLSAATPPADSFLWDVRAADLARRLARPGMSGASS